MARILLIEDHRDLLENTIELLELEGHEVHCAVNGIDGISKAKEVLPDIILCDVWMPGATGVEVIVELKKDAVTASIPFVFVSASVEKKDIEAALQLGANGYVNKPYEAEILFAEIARCLKQ